ncbi:hypothetical protein ALC57_03064 [Trachymyrmex cornetzi]|uniref:GIY-YIG domain-containing protein n=1 Tax=Trachymyrmex cornetzi TaxID=471704 RepID=A0A151JMN7_9HYME|nr:hypothetical protein ALC57_03064 [Trachymyrmex cornetzi]
MLNFYSNHPLCHKKHIIISIVDKIVRLSHPRCHQNNLIDTIKIFLNNCYPLYLIFSTINNRIKYHIHNNDFTHKVKQKFFSVPDFKSISESFLPISTKFNCNLAYSIPNTLKSFIKRGKDNLEHLSNQNVVYKISCEDCDASYVGQTKCKLSTRLHEHISDIKKRTGSSSVISDHRMNSNHDFKWNEVKILDKEASYNKRLISEIIFIKMQKQGINKQNDTEALPESYSQIIQSLSQSPS